MHIFFFFRFYDYFTVLKSYKSQIRIIIVRVFDNGIFKALSKFSCFSRLPKPTWVASRKDYTGSADVFSTLFHPFKHHVKPLKSLSLKRVTSRKKINIGYSFTIHIAYGMLYHYNVQKIKKIKYNRKTNTPAYWLCTLNI